MQRPFEGIHHKRHMHRSLHIVEESKDHKQVLPSHSFPLFQLAIMKISGSVALLAMAFQAPQVPVSSAMKLESLFSFQENNYYETSSSSNFIKAVSAGHQGESHEKDSSGSSFEQADATVAQGGSGTGKGKGGGKTKHDGYGDDNKCCTCTCYDNSDYSGDSRNYERGYDTERIDGEDYCQCSCSCGSKVTMPIIPTVPPPPSQPPIEPTSSPTVSLTVAPLCEIPPLIVPNPFADVVNVTDCGPGGMGTAVTGDNTLIELLNPINCDLDLDASSFLEIDGENNTVDCGGFSVTLSSASIIGFLFSGRNNVVQNCPNISGFTGNAIEVNQGTLYVFNVTATDNRNGLRIVNAEAYVDGSDLSENDRGVFATLDEPTNDPFKVIVINSSITQNDLEGAQFRGLGDACLAGNIISENNVNIRIRENEFGIPNVTLINNNACNSTENVDIEDNTAASTTIVVGTTCSFVEDGSGNGLNATVYGCEPCPP